MKKIFALLLLTPFLITITSCDEKDEDTLKLTTSETTLYQGDTFQIEAESDAPITYTSENEYYATVSKGGVVTAGFVGETNILLNNGKETKTVKVIIAPKHTIFNEPFIVWGTSKDDIAKKFGNPYGSNSSSYSYLNLNTKDVLQTLFIFDENNRLNGTGMYLENSNFAEAANGLQERYAYIGYEEEDDGSIAHLFVNALDEDDANMLIYTQQISDSYFVIVFMPYTTATEDTSSSRSAKSAKISASKIADTLNKYKIEIQK